LVFLNSLSRAKGQQDLVLRFFSRLLSTNALRAQQHANMTRLARDGFMLNTTALMLRVSLVLLVCLHHHV
jgi:hypothetical protein